MKSNVVLAVFVVPCYECEILCGTGWLGHVLYVVEILV